jgi:WD40 repeat protein
VTLCLLTLGSVPGIAGGATPVSELWTKRYDGPANDVDVATSVTASLDGSEVFVTGYSYGPAYHDYATIAYDASSGARLWSKRYDGPGNVQDRARALGVSPDGSAVFVTGGSAGSTSGVDYATVAYDASSGAELWVTRYNGPADRSDPAYALTVSPDGSAVFVTGQSVGSTSRADYATVAYDASSGAELWTRRYDGPGNASDGARALGVSPDGTAVFVTGKSTGSTSGVDYATVAYNASTGARLWLKRFAGPGDGFDFATALGVSPDGTRIFVAGSSFRPMSNFDYATVAYDASTGVRRWTTRYDGTGNSIDYANALGVTPDGTAVFVTGGSTGSTGIGDYATVAYDAFTGGRTWARRYDGPANDVDAATALGVAPDGSQVFVTGESIKARSSVLDYVTVAYAASTGDKRWSRRYDGPGNDYDVPGALAVSPDGAGVFVTGHSVGSTTDYDYATVAYRIG